MQTKKRYSIFLESLIGVLTILSFGIYLFNRGTKDKNEFTHIKGQIVYYSDSYETFPHSRDKDDKFKYLRIDNYPDVFEIRIPNTDDKSTFQYSNLVANDTIDIYFDKDNFAAERRVNRTAMYIDKGSVPILISIRKDKAAGIGFLITGSLILAGLCLLKWTNRIE